ncbi:hypothetical protein CDIK_1015 [Cucumispora dikerogammari]|nr:hypothetical protein CDIK_1015 [Cucumispora dikerogammari]
MATIQPADDLSFLSDSQLQEQIDTLNSPKITILKHKSDLLKIYLLLKKIYELENNDSEKKNKNILKTMKYTATLIEKINNLLNKMEYKEKTCKFEEQTKNEIMKNDGFNFMKSPKGNPKKTYRVKIDKYEGSKAKKQKVKIGEGQKNTRVFK